MSDTIDLWDQQPQETAPAFSAFRAYRDKLPNPSIRAVAKELGIHRSQLEKWSKQYGWDSRVRAYMRSQDQAARADQFAERKKMSADHIAISKALIAKGLARLTQLDPVLLKPAEAARFIALGVELEVKARAYATESLESLSDPALEIVAAKEAENQQVSEREVAQEGKPNLKLYSFDDELAGHG